jgi:aryl-alcohol dehydrogenase-like predicted oxidoreductase
LFFKEAKNKNIGIIARVPLASGMLSGKFNKGTEFEKDDHRSFNRKGEVFDQGETFSGVDYDIGLEAVEKIKSIFPGEIAMANIALKWILMFDAVSCVIPGVSRPDQLDSNLKTLNVRDFTEQEMKSVKEVYDKMIRPSVHHRW